MDRSTILHQGKKIIEAEIDTLSSVAQSLGTGFIDAVECIYQCKGKLIVVGIGKSAIIGQKIVSTLNSTGTSASFLHAGDALHGDLGIIGKQDVVLCISKSGETLEFRKIIPLLKDIGVHVIGILSHIDSYLALHSDIVIPIPVEQEADPNNLAPTSSTTAQLAVGDALAMVLQSINGFTPSQFATLHPGGSLGKTLNTTVGDLIKGKPAPAISPSESVSRAIFIISSGRQGATAVIKEDSLLGIITDGDLRRMLEKDLDPRTTTCQDIMSASPKTILSSAKASTVLDRMSQESITQLLVLDEDTKYIGIIHLHDLIKEGFR